MNSESENKLYIFFKETLKSVPITTPAPTWQEIEPMIVKKNKTINIPHQKLILVGGGVLLASTILIFILKSLSSSSDNQQKVIPENNGVVLSSDTLNNSNILFAPIVSDTIPKPVIVLPSPKITISDSIDDSITEKKEMPDSQKIILETVKPTETKTKKSKLYGLSPSISDTESVPEIILPTPVKTEQLYEETPLPLIVPKADTLPTDKIRKKKQKKAKETKINTDSIPAFNQNFPK